MTNDDKFAMKEFLRGVAFTIGIVGIAIMGPVLCRFLLRFASLIFFLLSLAIDGC